MIITIKRLAVLLIGLFSAYLTRAQNVSLQGIIPPSPQAAALGKYGTYPVGYFTGKPDINVPIYEIKTKNFSIPISLSYDATGIKVDDISSSVGMNWSLIAGGMLSRTVQIMPDEENYGYLHNPPPRAADVTNTPQYVDYIKHLLNLANSPVTYDTEPDKYTYTVPGKSGSFTFKSDKSIMQIPQTSVKIICDFANFKFRIIDENGVTYLFDTQERTQLWTGSSSADSDIKNILTGWYLTEMISADKTEHVYFNYADDYAGPIRTNNFVETYTGGNIGADNPLQKLWSGMERTIYSKRLVSIKFATGKVEFTNVAGRLDDLGTKLDEISVFSSSDATNYSKLKSYKLYQGYYTSTIPYAMAVAPYQFTHTDADFKRLRLDSIGIQDANSNIVSKYKFYYNTTMLPPKNSLGQDLWGYYNGHYDNKTLVRSTITPDYVPIGGAIRTADETSMKAGVLEKIEYPTGGYTIFDLEPHKYYSNYGVPVAHYTSAGAQGKDYPGAVHQMTVPFSATQATNGQATLTISFGPYNDSGNPPYADPNNGNLGIPPFVRIRDVTTSTEVIYTNLNPSDYYSYVIPFNPLGHDYELTAYNYANQDGAYSGISVNYNTYTAGQIVTVGGLRTKTIKNYNIDGSLSSQESYKYGETEDGLGKLVSFEVNTNYYIKYSTFYDPFVVGLIGYNTRGSVKTMDVYPSGPVFDLQYLQGSPVVYGYVTKYWGDATSNNIGKTVYHYNDFRIVDSRPFAKGSTMLNNIGILVTNDYWKRGNLLSEQNYKRNLDLTYTPVSKITNFYRDTITTATYGFATAVETFLSPDNNQFYQLYNFQFDEYPINTGYVQLTKTVNEENMPGSSNIVSATTDYTYDAARPDFRATSSIVNSTGQVIKDVVKYPFNKTSLLNYGALTASESLVLDSMVARNILSPVIEQSTYKDANFLQSTKTDYSFWDNSGQPTTTVTDRIYPKLVSTKRDWVAYEPRLEYLGYDNTGNLTSAHQLTGPHTSYVWGYNKQYPIAEAKNAPLNNIFHENFEEGAGNSARDKSKTGHYSKTNGTFTKSLTGLDAGSYVLRYWKKSGTGKWTLQTSNVTVTGGSYSISIGATATEWIDDVCFYPQSAQMSTYTYDALVGMTSATDVRGETTYYEYDSFQRLMNVKDKDGKIIKHHDYHYKN